MKSNTETKTHYVLGDDVDGRGETKADSKPYHAPVKRVEDPEVGSKGGSEKAD